MSDATVDKETPNPDEEGQEERLGCIARIIPVTTPGCATLLTVIFLLSTAITVWVVFWLDPSNVPWRQSYSWWRILGIIALVIAIPWVVHKTISLWLEGTSNAYPDLDYAWRAGMHALATNELSINSVPLFLITGSSGEAQEKAIMNASGLRLSVEGVPQGPAPMHWYANSEAIYLFCSDSSWTSALASLREEIAMEAAASGLSAESPSVMQSSMDLAEAIVRAQPQQPQQPEPEPQRPQSQNIRGTLELNDFVNPTHAKPPSQPAPSNQPTKSSQSSFRGTLMLGDDTSQLVSSPSTSPTNVIPASATPSPSRVLQQAPATRQTLQSSMPFTGEVNALSSKKPVLVSHQYSTSCLQELQYLGQLVCRARQPLCAINGVLSLIQFESIHSSQTELEELQRAIRGDLETIRYAFQVRVPVSALVVGLEKERGFRELISRVGKERARSQRFGRRFDMQAVPEKDQLVALATHLCGVFEDWCYTLFREEHALTRPGNTRLYELLSKVRCGWKGRLGEILSGGFGSDTTKRGEESSSLFSGCYFAATGDTPDRQAFVRGVVEKMGEEQELIEWTPEALGANKRQNISANLGVFVALGLLASLIVMYFFLR